MKSRALALAPFTVVFATFFIYLRTFGDPHFYYDAANYWALGGTFGPAGHFSLLDFNSSIRGYSLPLLNRALAAIASHLGMGSVTIVQVFGSLEAALLGTVLVPRLVRALWPSAEITPARILLFNGIVFLFWRDHFGFPLSDFPALVLGVAALLALTRRSLAGYAFAGLALGLAWNVRQGYLVTLLVVLIVVVIRYARSRARLRGLTAVGVLLTGVLVASLPQMLINHRHAHSWSPTVVGGRGVVLTDLTFGMNAQRYETNVGTKFPSPKVFYLDRSTQKLMAQDHISSIQSYSQYAGIVERHPTEMLAGWGRRVFNGFDVRYATPYIHDLGATSEWFSLLNYTLLFAAASRLLVPAFRRQLGTVVWPEALALAAACVTAIPFAVEPRYFLPIQLIVYSIVAFGPGTRRGFSELGRPGQVTLAIVYPVFLLVCVTLSASTIALIAPG